MPTIELQTSIDAPRERVFDLCRSFTSPLGVLGSIADALLVTRHMRRFLERRMAAIRRLAESDDGSRYLDAARRVP